MISITTVHMHMQKHRRTLCCSGTNVLLISVFDCSTQGKRQFLKVFRNQRSAHLVIQSQFLNPLVGPNSSTPWPELNFKAEDSILCPSGRSSMVCLHGPQSTPNWPFFKIFKFSGPSLPGVTSFTLQLISYLGFIMTIVIVISFAHEHKLYPTTVHLN